jgi:hypothetical protein
MNVFVYFITKLSGAKQDSASWRLEVFIELIIAYGKRLLVWPNDFISLV